MKYDMRVILTKRLLREGLLRCLKKTHVEKITISDLCRESGINRTTFYKHYQAPIQILEEMAWDYAEQLRQIYTESMRKTKGNSEQAMESCFAYLLGEKEQIVTLFSENAASSLDRMAGEIVSEMMSDNKTGWHDIMPDTD